MKPVKARQVMITPDGHCAPTVFTFDPARPLEIHIQALIPPEGVQEWTMARAWLAGGFYPQDDDIPGDQQVFVSGQVISFQLTLPDERQMVLSGPSDPIWRFLDETFNTCPACTGCADEFCLCCAALGRQVDGALAGLFESEGA